MQTVAETPLFIKQAAELFSEDERKELIDFLVANSQAGDEIPSAGGVRKMRFGAKGKDVPGIKVHAVGAVDAKAIRKKLDLTQDEMPTVLGTSPSGYKKWDQGVRQPSGAARTLLRVMDREPEAVLRALSSDDRGAESREAAH